MTEYLLDEATKELFDMFLIDELHTTWARNVEGIVLEKIDYAPPPDKTDVQGMGRRVMLPKEDGVIHQITLDVYAGDTIEELAILAAREVNDLIEGNHK